MPYAHLVLSKADAQGFLTLYQGTNTVFAERIHREGIRLIPGWRPLDFGVGFYLTTTRPIAAEWARGKSDPAEHDLSELPVGLRDSLVANAQRREPSVLMYRVRAAALLQLNPYRIFGTGVEEDASWLDFVCYNRTPDSERHGFHWVYGALSRSVSGAKYAKVPQAAQLSLHSPEAMRIVQTGAVAS